MFVISQSNYPSEVPFHSDFGHFKTLIKLDHSWSFRLHFKTFPLLLWKTFGMNSHNSSSHSCDICAFSKPASEKKQKWFQFPSRRHLCLGTLRLSSLLCKCSVSFKSYSSRIHFLPQCHIRRVARWLVFVPLKPSLRKFSSASVYFQLLFSQPERDWLEQFLST